MSMKSSKKGGRSSMPSNRHLKNTKVQNNFSCGGSNSLNWRTETTKNSVNESNNYGYTNHYVASSFYMLIGLEVEIQKSDGIIYEGILETVSNKVEFHLSHACEKNSYARDGSNKNEKMCKKIIFPFNDVVYCKACNVDLDFARRDTLLTDSAITGTNGAFNERELVQWQPEDPGEAINSELGENDTNAGWAFDEMMRVNEEEHGVKSTYDSSLSSYMTPLEKGDEEEFRAREKRAEQVAREIQKDPKFKELENVDSGMTEEELFSAVTTRASPSNNNNNGNLNNSVINNSNSNSPHNNDGFTTYTGKNYRASRHSKQPQSVVGPRLQRNLRNHDGQNHTSNGNHQVNRNHVSCPQRSQNGNPSRNISYQHQTSPQLPPHTRIENHKIPVGHQLSENIPLINNIRTQGDPASATSARTTLTYSAVAMKKNPTPANNNNRVNTAPKPAMTLQTVVPDIIQPVLDGFAAIPPPNNINPTSPLVTNLNSAATPPPNLTSPLVSNGHTAQQKVSQPAPCRTPEALAAAKQQVIQDAKKKASLGHGVVPTLPQTPPLIPTTTTLACSQVTASIISISPVTSPLQQPPLTQSSSQMQRQPTLPISSVPSTRSQSYNTEVAEKAVRHSSTVSLEAPEKSLVNFETKPSESAFQPAIPASVSPKDQRSRGEDGKQFLMKYGRIQTAAEEKKESSLKELKDFGEHFKLEAKPKKRLTGKIPDGTSKVPELPVKSSETPTKLKSDERLPGTDDTDVTSKPVVSKTEDVRPVTSDITSTYTSPHSSPHLVVTTVPVSPAVTNVSTLMATAVTTVMSMAPLGEPSSPTMKSALNPTAKEFNLNPSAKEFNPVKESAVTTFSSSPKPPLSKQPSFPGEQVQQMVQQQAYYHSQAVMIHPNGSEVLSPTVQSLPVKQIYARPYMSSGPGGPAVYSIPTVEFSNNGNNSGPQLIATPQSGFIPAQSISGQQVIIIHGPNGSYQHVVPGGQSQQQYYMQQMIRCVPGHHGGNGVQPNANRVPANFQPDTGQGGAYVLAVSQHAGLVQHQVPSNQHQGYHPPQSPVQSTHIQTQYAMSHQVATSFHQNPQNAAPLTYTQGNSAAQYRSPSSIHSVAGQHHPQQPFVMMTHQGQHIQTVAMANNPTYVQGQPHSGGILQNYQAGN